jgi:hypothetical protein
MEDRETPRMHKYGESKTTWIMMATVHHMTSSSGLRKFQASWFSLNRGYQDISSGSPCYITILPVYSDIVSWWLVFIRGERVKPLLSTSFFLCIVIFFPSSINPRYGCHFWQGTDFFLCFGSKYMWVVWTVLGLDHRWHYYLQDLFFPKLVHLS